MAHPGVRFVVSADGTDYEHRTTIPYEAPYRLERLDYSAPSFEDEASVLHCPICYPGAGEVIDQRIMA